MKDYQTAMLCAGLTFIGAMLVIIVDHLAIIEHALNVLAGLK